ncbi:MAG: hypothetical protein FWE53_02590 [Firmicutes bacterium]|nr:hypothetical protein [Bacillota bacterium]
MKERGLPPYKEGLEIMERFSIPRHEYNERLENLTAEETRAGGMDLCVKKLEYDLGKAKQEEWFNTEIEPGLTRRDFIFDALDAEKAEKKDFEYEKVLENAWKTNEAWRTEVHNTFYPEEDRLEYLAKEYQKQSGLIYLAELKAEIERRQAKGEPIKITYGTNAKGEKIYYYPVEDEVKAKLAADKNARLLRSSRRNEPKVTPVEIPEGVKLADDEPNSKDERGTEPNWDSMKRR